MRRINQADLQGVVNRLNELTGSPLAPWTRDNGRNTANIGCYTLDSAYGGHSLDRIMSDGGGVHKIINGYHSKRELYYMIHTYIDGLFVGMAMEVAKKCEVTV